LEKPRTWRRIKIEGCEEILKPLSLIVREGTLGLWQIVEVGRSLEIRAKTSVPQPARILQWGAKRKTSRGNESAREKLFTAEATVIRQKQGGNERRGT